MKSKLTLITVKIPMKILQEVDELVKEGVFVSRSEAVREALKLLLSRYGEGHGREESSDHR
jgi:Predicted transcriptional regulators containing the CopG/Arc/MetJ DNA-binding domain and a metal-binding domain